MRLKHIEIDRFLSYNFASIDLENLRKVLIVGTNNGDLTNSNGSGKTNLCEAIGWAIWGDSKAKTIDLNVKHDATMCSVRVDFEHDGKECSITRTRNRITGSTTLNFVINGEPSNGKSAPDTDKKIIDFIKVDYLTYINSVYLRQDDIFSLANPKKSDESRAVIENVLNLKEYDKYEEFARNKIKEIEKLISEINGYLEANKNLESNINELNKKIIDSKLEIDKYELEVSSLTEELSKIENKYMLEKRSLD